MASIVDRLSVDLYVGTSGWSYPSWRPGFYPAGMPNEEFLRFYAKRLPSVERNTTGYRLPSEEQFERWAAEAPAGFRFAVKLPQRALRSVATFEERVLRLGERLGPVRVAVESPRDDGMLALLLGSTDLRLAFDFRHESWDGVDVAPAVRVDDWDAEGSFRYVRFREPPYSDDDLVELATRVRPLLDRGVEVFAYFRHEDEPSAAAYAERLRELVLGDAGALSLHSRR
ncbi:MAG: DUF72 domain-containing protein [Gaiellaceae bacterium]